MPKRSKDDPSIHYQRKEPLHGDGRYAESEVIKDNQRICRICQQWKDFSCFGKSKVGVAGIKARCRDCENQAARERYANGDIYERRKEKKSLYDKQRRLHLKAEGKAKSAEPEIARERMLRRNYGMTPNDYTGMVISQDNKCAICLISGENVRNQRLVVDHCHASGNVRGLLCPKCNLLLGHAEDSIDRLLRAIDYLRNRGEG